MPTTLRPYTRGAAEQRVDRGTVPVLGRPVHETELPGPHHEVHIGRCHVNATGLDGLAVLGPVRRQRAGPAQDRGEGAEGVGPQVQHHEDRSRKVAGKAPDQPLQ